MRLFANAGLEMFVSQSFGKNMGLYGERIGFLSGIQYVLTLKLSIAQLF